MKLFLPVAKTFNTIKTTGSNFELCFSDTYYGISNTPLANGTWSLSTFDSNDLPVYYKISGANTYEFRFEYTGNVPPYNLEGRWVIRYNTWSPEPYSQTFYSTFRMPIPRISGLPPQSTPTDNPSVYWNVLRSQIEPRLPLQYCHMKWGPC